MLDERAILGEVGPQHLDRDRALEREILGAIHDAHAAAADLVQQPVDAAERGAQVLDDVDLLREIRGAGPVSARRDRLTAVAAPSCAA